jgi:hypothetical protein
MRGASDFSEGPNCPNLLLASKVMRARDYAEAVARSLIASPDLQDWRNCRVRVWDDLGEEVFVMPFSSIVGKPH